MIIKKAKAIINKIMEFLCSICQAFIIKIYHHQLQDRCLFKTPMLNIKLLLHSFLGKDHQEKFQQIQTLHFNQTIFNYKDRDWTDLLLLDHAQFKTFKEQASLHLHLEYNFNILSHQEECLSIKISYLQARYNNNKVISQHISSLVNFQ